MNILNKLCFYCINFKFIGNAITPGRVAYGTYTGLIVEHHNPQARFLAPGWSINEAHRHIRVDKWILIGYPSMKYSRNPTLIEFKTDGDIIFNTLNGYREKFDTNT